MRSNVYMNHTNGKQASKATHSKATQRQCKTSQRTAKQCNTRCPRSCTRPLQKSLAHDLKHMVHNVVKKERRNWGRVRVYAQSLHSEPSDFHSPTSMARHVHNKDVVISYPSTFTPALHMERCSSRSRRALPCAS